MQCLIETAGRDAESDLFDLIRELAAYEQLEPPDQAARARMAEDLWGERPRATAWLATVDGKRVGYAFTFETYSTFLARPSLYLEDLFVLPEYRRMGVGEAIFRRLADEAIQRGCGRMEWACLNWNEPGLNFYAKLGATQMHEWTSFRLTADQLAALAASGED